MAVPPDARRVFLAVEWLDELRDRARKARAKGFPPPVTGGHEERLAVLVYRHGTAEQRERVIRFLPYSMRRQIVGMRRTSKRNTQRAQ